MDKRASELMGERVIAGVTLEAAESIKGVMDGVVGKTLADVVLKPASVPGDHKGIHYVAVGPTRVGFFSMKRGLFKPSLDRLLVECSRSDVQAVEIKGGMMPAAHFVLRDGTNYALMCPRSSWVSSKRCSSY
jgi:hypothetical protein